MKRPAYPKLRNWKNSSIDSFDFCNLKELIDILQDYIAKHNADPNLVITWVHGWDDGGKIELNYISKADDDWNKEALKKYNSRAAKYRKWREKNPEEAKIQDAEEEQRRIKTEIRKLEKAKGRCERQLKA